jgi:hypothetical protein
MAAFGAALGIVRGPFRVTSAVDLANESLEALRAHSHSLGSQRAGGAESESVAEVPRSCVYLPLSRTENLEKSKANFAISHGHPLCSSFSTETVTNVVTTARRRG